MALPEYRLEMDRTDRERFMQQATTERYLAADLTYGRTTLPVWVGYRGRYSRNLPKRSYDIWLQPGGRLEGHARLHLNAAYRDPSLLRGRLAFDVFGALGVLVPRAWHAWLTLNDRPLGLYTAIESIDGDWLARQGEQEGAIYYSVGGEGNFGLISRKTKKPKVYVAAGYEKCFPDDDDFSDLERLIYRITLPSDASFAAEIDRTVDVERCLRWLIGVIFTSHTDGLVHNYALLRRPGQRWEISPWDCDGTWGRTPYGGRLPFDGVRVDQADGNYLARRLLADSGWRRRYRRLWEEALRGPLAPQRVEERVRSIYAEIRYAVRQDSHKWRSNAAFEREIPDLNRWAEARTAFLHRQVGQL